MKFQVIFIFDSEYVGEIFFHSSDSFLAQYQDLTLVSFNGSKRHITRKSKRRNNIMNP
jgi:hypothetical protein